MSHSSLQQRRTPTGRRWQSTDAAAAQVSPKIAGIVDQISTLTLLETADLVSSLKARLNIPDISFAPPAAAGGGAPGAAAAAPVEEEEAAAPAAAEKSLFNVKLVSFDAGAKAKVIKEVKALLGLSLVETAPKILKEGAVKDEAEKIKATMEGLGAKVEVD
ncbi:54S ribosomal protein L12, mitochondrial [Cyphellophora attinorum]|uniref:54S ribosomal protein L12, mitochondrial n=1 Tax=Cyphellophora attinorum TaxID=1664694 RepID=A0A0N0NM31_9EURO|nr:54S ribosomal protein L12, mitochondrial [Phialophora attinorum]KPI39878.1 54S ribosomal protein L12, mitochondrial [Phialophora attinorum]